MKKLEHRLFFLKESKSPGNFSTHVVDQLPAIKTVDYKLNLAIDYENDQKGPNRKSSMDIPMIDHGNKGITDLSYLKGMIFFNLLYELVGEKEFFNIIKTFYREYEGKGATTDDFANHLKRQAKIHFPI